MPTHDTLTRRVAEIMASKLGASSAMAKDAMQHARRKRPSAALYWEGWYHAIEAVVGLGVDAVRDAADEAWDAAGADLSKIKPRKKRGNGRSRTEKA